MCLCKQTCEQVCEKNHKKVIWYRGTDISGRAHVTYKTTSCLYHLAVQVLILSDNYRLSLPAVIASRVCTTLTRPKSRQEVA